MNPLIRGLLASGLAVLALAACASSMPSQQPAGMAAAEQPKLAFTVSGIELASTFQAPAEPNHVEGLLPVSLENRVADWAKTHMSAAGGADVARFTITDASLVKTELDENVGAPGLLRAPQTIRYDASIAVSFEIVNKFGLQKGYTNATVSLARTMASYESDAARDVLLQDLTEAIMKEFGAEMEKALRANVGGYIM